MNSRPLSERSTRRLSMTLEEALELGDSRRRSRSKGATREPRASRVYSSTTFRMRMGAPLRVRAPMKPYDQTWLGLAAGRFQIALSQGLSARMRPGGQQIRQSWRYGRFERTGRVCAAQRGGLGARGTCHPGKRRRSVSERRTLRNKIGRGGQERRTPCSFDHCQRAWSKVRPFTSACAARRRQALT